MPHSDLLAYLLSINVPVDSHNVKLPRNIMRESWIFVPPPRLYDVKVQREKVSCRSYVPFVSQSNRRSEVLEFVPLPCCYSRLIWGGGCFLVTPIVGFTISKQFLMHFEARGSLIKHNGYQSRK
jgi:hypothetical protein